MARISTIEERVHPELAGPIAIDPAPPGQNWIGRP